MSDAPDDEDGYGEDARALLPWFPEMLSWDLEDYTANRDEMVSWIFATV